MNINTQIVIIHGGMTFDTYEEYLSYLKSYNMTRERLLNKKDWKNTIAPLFPDNDVFFPTMPNNKNAQYEEWKLWFEKLFPLLTGEVVLVGHSLGGIFLAKYLSENTFPQKIASLHFVAAPYNTEYVTESLGTFTLGHTVERLSSYTDKIFFYQSMDDTEVAYQDVQKYIRDVPGATLRMFENRGHFLQAEFPELIEDIKNI